MSEQPELDGLPEVSAVEVEPDVQPNDTAAAPRRRGRPRGSTNKTTKASTPRRAAKVNIKQGMTDIYVVAASAVMMIPSAPAYEGSPVSKTQAIGHAIAANAPQIGAAWEQLANDNPAVREALERILAVSAVGLLVSAHVPILLTAATVYGLVPPMVAASLQPQSGQE